MSNRSSVLVVTHELIDVGAGAHRAVVFPDASHHIDDGGVLHVRSTVQGRGNIAAFADGEWRTVIGGIDVFTIPVTIETIGDADATRVTVGGGR